ncbi:MAG: hypothetical protein ACK559_02560 [bacterium]
MAAGIHVSDAFELRVKLRQLSIEFIVAKLFLKLGLFDEQR